MARLPRCEQREPLGRRRARLGGVDEHHEAGLARERELLIREREFAGHRVEEALRAGAVRADVVRAPQATERLTLRRELADKARYRGPICAC